MMTLSENHAFITDLQEVIKKHGLSIMYSNNPQKLVEETKGLEGYHMFFTKGEKKLALRGGESMVPHSSLTIRFSKPNTEDDGC
jgi:hypothetical protein